MSERRRMPNSTLPYASGPIGSKKSAAQKKRDTERKAREFARKYGSEERCYYVATLHCVVPSCTRTGWMENAHTESGGTGRKADAETIVPACAKHHRTGADSLHNLGRESFQHAHGVDLEIAAAETDVSWLLYGDDVVERAKANGRFDKWKNRRHAA